MCMIERLTTAANELEIARLRLREETSKQVVELAEIMRWRAYRTAWRREIPAIIAGNNGGEYGEA